MKTNQKKRILISEMIQFICMRTRRIKMKAYFFFLSINSNNEHRFIKYKPSHCGFLGRCSD